MNKSSTLNVNITVARQLARPMLATVSLALLGVHTMAMGMNLTSAPASLICHHGNCIATSSTGNIGVPRGTNNDMNGNTDTCSLDTGKSAGHAHTDSNPISQGTNYTDGPSENGGSRQESSLKPRLYPDRDGLGGAGTTGGAGISGSNLP